MVRVTKIDFQGDDLFVQYTKSGDSGRNVKQRILIVDWKKNVEIMRMLDKLFQAVVDAYMDIEDTINWTEFENELKKYEERNKK